MPRISLPDKPLRSALRLLLHALQSRLVGALHERIERLVVGRAAASRFARRHAGLLRSGLLLHRREPRRLLVRLKRSAAVRWLLRPNRANGLPRAGEYFVDRARARRPAGHFSETIKC